MQTHVTKWGNSLGIRIPRLLAQKAGFTEGTAVDFEVEEDALILRRKSYNLEQLLARVTPQNIPGEVKTGPPVGREIW